jgi:serine protease
VTDPDAVEEQLTGSAKVLDDSAAGRKKFGAGLLQAGDAAEGVLRTQIMTRMLALLAMLVLALGWARRRGKALSAEVISGTSFGLWLGGITAGVGLLFFAPWVGLSRHLLWVDLLSRPLGEWDMLLGANVHKLLPFANVLVPLFFAAVLLKAKSASAWVAGISVGTAAYLASVALLGQLATPFGAVLTIVWCAVNALACLYLASLLLVRRA